MALCVHSFRSTAIDTAISSQFFSSEASLIFVQNLNINVYRITAKRDLDLFTTIPLWYAVRHLQTYRPQGLNRDYLFVVLQDDTYFTLYWDEDFQKVNIDHPPLRYRISFPWSRFTKSHCLVDKKMRMIFLSIDEVFMLCINILSAEERQNSGCSINDGFPISFPVNPILDICLLNYPKIPTLVVLHSEGVDSAITAFPIDVESKNLENGIRLFESVLPSKIIPFGKRGLLVLDRRTIHCFYRGGVVTINSLPRVYNHWVPLEGYDNHFIVSDENGDFYAIYSSILAGKLWNLTFEKLDILPVTFITSLVSLNDDLLFIGSHGSCSKLISLQDLSDTFTLPNLGPIHDINMYSSDQSQTMLVCAGSFKNPSILHYRHALFMNFLGFFECSGIVRVMVLSSHVVEKLFIVFVDETLVFDIDIKKGFQLELVPELSINERTIALSGTGTDNQFIQVTSKSLYIYDSMNLSKVVHLDKITNATCYKDYSAIVLGGLELVIFQKDVEISRIKFDSEISCLEMASESNIAIGFWSKEVLIFNFLINLDSAFVFKSKLPSLPRNVILENFNSEISLFLVSYGDGFLVSYVLSRNILVFTEMKKLGTTPIVFSRLNVHIGTYIICNNDQPHMVYGFNGTLGYMPLNMPVSYDVCQFSKEIGTTGLVAVSSKGVSFLEMDRRPHLYANKFPLSHVPLRAVILDQILLTITLHPHSNSTDGLNERYSLLLLDYSSGKQLEKYDFPLYDRCEEILRIENGTIVVAVNNHQIVDLLPSSGKLLLYRFMPDLIALNCINTVQLSAAVSCLSVYEKGFIASFGHFVGFFDILNEKMGMKTKFCVGNLISQIIVDSEQNILIGDVVGFITVLRLENYTFVMYARYNIGERILTALCFERNKYVFASDSGVLHIVRLETIAESEQINGQIRLITEAQYRLHDKVTRFCLNTLPRNSPSDKMLEPRLYFGTRKGAIGSIFSLNSNINEFDELAKKIRQLELSYLPIIDLESIEEENSNEIPFVNGDIITNTKAWSSTQIFRLCRLLEHAENLNSHEKVRTLLDEVQLLS
ncbi:CLRC ubiquitin ligase complex WD repeat protein Rik1 [Schizosaccharomyces osmophilus]|uniref:CLRC ubiquitin ligase complex WD repeat protein Rik1 n=1 Tax=Schizosaccharomyces osmophilus TaxID=2545709 RepID=A0AAF0AXI0_9SCHI|nr:CLRC ubiquitin ligase complex WD repeat protein Rik1 [Schizosaccharomyces osmophilus]WBW74792.1 CLRC ubiquitin ligase complex WD repeat protein Rik1 [Schizosaccharomyces osmophilus]